MGLFGKSFEEKVNEALDELRQRYPVKNLSAQVDDKVVTLSGVAASRQQRDDLVRAFNERVKTENTLNTIRVDEVAAKPAAANAEGTPKAATPPAAPAGAADTVMPGPQAPAGAASARSGGLPADTAPADAPTERMHVVARGDTLSGIAKQYYGNAGQYMKIFEANRDQLDNPDLIKPGQKLRIPD